MVWQPIETVPEDTPVLVYGPGLRGRPEMAVAEKRVFKGGYVSWDAVGVGGPEWEFGIEPTHWAPLPEGPKP